MSLPKSAPTPDPLRPHWWARLGLPLSRRQLLPVLTAGLVVGINAVTVSLAFAGLLFSGNLATYTPLGLGIMLFGSATTIVIVALFSSLRGVVSGIQDTPVAPLMLIAVVVGERLAAAGSGRAALATVVAATILTSLLTGLVFFLLGTLKLGSLVGFIPYPVVGGFLAGSGLLLVTGALSAMGGTSISLQRLAPLAQAGVLFRVLPGVLLGAILLVLMRRFTHLAILPGTLAVGILLFYVLLALTHTSVATAAGQGWLLGGVSRGGALPWPPLGWPDLAQVNWLLLGQQAGTIAAIVVVSVVAVLLSLSSIELATGHEIDLNRELKAAGAGNIVAGLGGSPVSFHVLSDTTLVYRMGAANLLIPIMAAAICLGVMRFGGTLLSYIPWPVLGGLLIYQGLDFLVTWVYQAWFKLPHADYVVMILILVVINTLGLLQGVGLGLILTIILFVVSYGRVSVVRHTLSGATMQSNVERPRLYRQLLQQKGDWLYILQLQGFIFFGTANRLFEQIRGRFHDPSLPSPRFVLLDFRRVRGLDSSAVFGFAKIKRLAHAYQAVLILTHLSAALRRQLTPEVLGKAEQDDCRTFADLDHGLEWCENRLIDLFREVGLSTNSRRARGATGSWLQAGLLGRLFDALAPAGQERPQGELLPLEQLAEYMVREEVPAGHCLIRQGEVAGGLYILDCGQVTIQTTSPHGQVVRLRTAEAGAVLGELGLYLGGPASASVVATQPSTVYYLSPDKLEEMERQGPQLAISFHRAVAALLSERVAGTTAALQALLDEPETRPTKPAG